VARDGHDMKYILNDNGDPVACEDPLTWAKWFETANRRVVRDELPGGSVSTVFLGLDHAFGGGPPLLWETMVFGGEHDGYCDRYSTLDDALEGHRKAVDLVNSGS
jgi:hypothetical protein